MHFVLTEDELRIVRDELARSPSIDRVYSIDLTGPDGDVYAIIEKTLHIKRKG